jgi:hypothetical protein
MAVSKRFAATALAVVALALTATGVVLAATDPNPDGTQRDHLVLNGYPPRSVQLHVVVSTGQAYDVTADVNVNFATNAVAADVQIPMFFSATHVELLLVGSHLYATSPNLDTIIGTHWLSAPTSAPSLYGLSLEMTKPDVSMITGFTEETVTHNGYFTTYDFRRDNVAIATPSGLPFKVPKRANVDFSITLGRQSELTATSFAVSSGRTRASVSVTVLSYNAPARIVAPPASDVTPFSAARIKQIFGSTSIGNLFNPNAVSSLGQIRLN